VVTAARRRTRLSNTVKNSSDVSSDIEVDKMKEVHSYPAVNKLFKGVEIPALGDFNRRTSVDNSSLSSGFSHDGDQSNGYDTPNTSVAVTPALDQGLAIRGSSTARRSSRKLATQSKTPSATTKSSITRKTWQDITAEYKEEQADQDEMLARALQDEEYEDQDATELSDVVLPKKALSGKRKVADSEDEDGQWSIETTDYSCGPTRNRTKRVKTDLRPIRAARIAATSTTEKTFLSMTEDGLLPDENKSALSEFTAASDLSGLESELSDIFMDDSASDQPTTSSNSANATKANRSALLARARQRRQAAPRRRMIGQTREEYERAKLELAHPEIKTLWTDLEKVDRITPEIAEQPKWITRQLKPFQLQGLNWMMRQEKSQWKGGLLGDEMGMGKTIQAVSLIMSDYPQKAPTLVIVPPVALMQWSSEIKSYTDGKLKVLVHHNTDPKVKKLSLKDLQGYDVIMISYSGLESMYRKESKGWKRDDGLVKENSKIHAIHYHRLILDEAHNIKTRTTSVAKACFALKADYKWCLSGTPVQNRIGEFFSLLRFLEVTPFASYFCKTCACAKLHWVQNAEKKCQHCNHSGFQHVSIFNQELLNPITQQGDPTLRKEALSKLPLITDRIMLRRLKKDHTTSMELPPKEVIIHNEFFGEIERDFSTSIMTNTTRTFDRYVSRGVMLNNYANIFGLIMQMRQVANHPDLILKKHAEGGQNVLICCICDEVAEEPIRSRCHHEFCRGCAKDYVRSMGEDSTPDCPRCHIALTIDFDQPDIEQDEEHVKKSSIINRIKMEDWTSSTKIEMLIYDLYKLRSKKQTHKSIVFSQFTSMLQLVEWRLRRAGFSTVMLDGSMSPAQRQRSIEYFMNNVDCEVFLVSLKAGGVALNLTEASRVFIIDP
jgi:DNA repair protein RAD16